MLFVFIIIVLFILMRDIGAQPVPSVVFAAPVEAGFREVLPGVWTGYSEPRHEATLQPGLGDEFPHLNPVLPLTGAWRVHHPANGSPGRTGAGVVVCIIDSGIDLAHPDFRAGPAGSPTRILRLWDQTIGRAPLLPGERRPAGFSYGVEYRREEVENSAVLVRSTDASGHGTHLAGLIAGSGAASGGRYRGMAPDADLVVIRAGTDRFPLAHILDGMAYCDDVARSYGRPAVLNLSFGAPLGPHDGSDLKNRMASAFAAQPGRAVVLSAGNTGHLARHVVQTLVAGQETRLVVHIPPHTSGGIGHERLALEVWLPHDLPIAARLISPGGEEAAFMPANAYTHLAPGGGWYLDHHLSPDAQRLHAQLYATEASRSLPHGAWQVAVESRGAHPPAHVHAWLHGTGPLEASRWEGGTTAFGINNAAEGGIVVGAFQHQPTWCSVSGTCRSSPDVGWGPAPFSSRGPSRDGRLLPHLLAPGQLVVAPHPGGGYAAVEGTSYAAAVVTGAVALLLEAQPTLTGTALRTALMEAAQAPPGNPETPNPIHGAGYLDVEAALHALEGIPPATERISCGAGPKLYLALGDELRLPLRPSRRMVLRQALVDLPHRTSARVRVRAEHSTYPAQEQEVNLPEHALGRTILTFSPPFVVEEGTTVSLEPIDAPLTIAGSRDETGAPCTSVHAGQARPAGAAVWVWLEDTPAHLPVRWTSFSGWAEGRHVRLTWETAEEVNTADFRVEHRREGQPWAELGSVPARGEAGTYSYLSPALPWGRYEFRLRQNDLDGTFTYSTVLSVAVQPDVALAAGVPYPNPARERVHIPLYSASDAPVRVEVWNLQGRLMLSKEKSTDQDNGHLTLDLASWAPGMYLYALSTPENRLTGRFVRAP